MKPSHPLIPNLDRPLEWATYVVIAFVLIGIGYLHGLHLTVITVRVLSFTVRVVFLEAISSSLVFMGFILLTTTLLFAEFVRSSSPSGSKFRRHGDTVTAIIPVYRDHNVLEQSVSSLLESAYESLEIRIVCEPTDERSIDEAKRLSEHERVDYLVNRNPGSKAGAINDAVERTRSSFVAVFDADERVNPTFVPVAMYWLRDEEYDVFQGRRIPYPSGPIETLAYCERVIFHASYKLVEFLGFYNCRSSSTVFTRNAFETVNGYDDMLTEDLAFAHKCFRHGLRVRHDRTQCNQMEAPHTLTDLWGQRKRWRIGQIEVLHASLAGRMKGPIDRRYLISLLRICSSLVGSLFTLMLLSKFLILLVLDLEFFYIGPVLAVWTLSASVAAYDRRNNGIPIVNWSVLLAPLIYPAFGLLTIKAVLEYSIRWEGEWYRVRKTGI